MKTVDVSKWIEESGLNKRNVSRRSGVARTTVDRIIKDVRPAKWDTLEEVAAACGIQLEVIERPLADSNAVEAVRMVVELNYVPSDLDAAERWLTRLQRWQEDTDKDQELLMLAAKAANLRGRPDVKRFSSNQFDSLIDAAQTVGCSWAVSGVPAKGAANGGNVVIFWASDADRIHSTAQVSEVDSSEQVDDEVWLIPAPLSLFQGSTTVGGINFVSELQALLDQLSLGN